MEEMCMTYTLMDTLTLTLSWSILDGGDVHDLHIDGGVAGGYLDSHNLPGGLRFHTMAG